MMAEQKTPEQLTASLRRPFPWFRILLVLAYLGIISLAGIYEYNAFRIISKARELESRNKYMTAAVAYNLVIENYPFSFRVPEARDGLYRTEPSVKENQLIARKGSSVVEEMLGQQFSPYTVDWLPLACCAVSGLLALFVFMTRLIQRAVIALVSLVCAVAATGCLLAQLQYYGIVSISFLSELGNQLVPNVPLLYGSASAVALFAAMLSLTTIKRQRRISEPTERSSAKMEARMVRLNAIYDEGLIDEQEYVRRRKELLAEL